MSKLALALATAVSLSSGSNLPASARDGAKYEGTWTVELTTESGALCEARYTYSLMVQDGRIRPISTATAGDAAIMGRVSGDGVVGLTVSTRAANGTASGQLQTRGGGGTWKVSSLCSGRWTAHRQTTRTAQAE